MLYAQKITFCQCSFDSYVTLGTHEQHIYNILNMGLHISVIVCGNGFSNGWVSLFSKQHKQTILNPNTFGKPAS